MSAKRASGGGKRSDGASVDGGAPRTEEEVMELLRKLKEAAKVPDHAMRKVRRLDEMIAGLRKHRAEAQEVVDASEKRLSELDEAQNTVHRKLRPLRSQYEEHLSERKRVADALAQAESAIAGYISTTRDQRSFAVRKSAEHRKADVRDQLERERGFSTRAAASPHRQGPPKSMRLKKKT